MIFGKIINEDLKKIVDLNKKITINNKDMQSKCKWTPYHGETFKGSPIATIISGKIKIILKE